MHDKTCQVEAPSASKPYWVYLLECADGSFYCGIALDVQARFAQHLAGTSAAYTRSHKPVRVMGSQQYPSRGEALRAEYQVKRLPKNRKLAFLRQAPPHTQDMTQGGGSPAHHQSPRAAHRSPLPTP